MLYNCPVFFYNEFSSCEKQTVGLHVTWWQKQLNQDRETSNAFHVGSCCVRGITAKPTGHIPAGKRKSPLVFRGISWSQEPCTKALVYSEKPDSTSI